MKFEVQRVEYPTPKVKFLVEVDLAEVAGMRLGAFDRRLLEVLKRLSFCAQTTGGVAGRDDELCSAIEASAKAIAEAEAQQERLLQDMHDAGREIDRVMAEAAPKAVRLTEVEVDACFDVSDGTRVGAARAIESAVLRKNGIEVAE